MKSSMAPCEPNSACSTSTPPRFRSRSLTGSKVLTRRYPAKRSSRWDPCGNGLKKAFIDAWEFGISSSSYIACFARLAGNKLRFLTLSCDCFYGSVVNLGSSAVGFTHRRTTEYFWHVEEITASSASHLLLSEVLMSFIRSHWLSCNEYRQALQ